MKSFDIRTSKRQVVNAFLNLKPLCHMHFNKERIKRIFKRRYVTLDYQNPAGM